jgi:hypothetical protein
VSRRDRFLRSDVPKISEDLPRFGDLAEYAPPFSGVLMNGSDASAWLVNSLASSDGPVSLCSAYLRSEALAKLLAPSRPGLRGRILVRWQLGDLLAGASDLHAYEVARDAGLDFAVRHDFHGKVFSIPERGLLVGSANATLSGLGMRGGANEEVCTVVPGLPANLGLIDGLFAGAVRIDDELFSAIRTAVLATPSDSKEPAVWPPHLMAQLERPHTIERLLVEECLWSTPQTFEDCVIGMHERDRLLLGLPTLPISIEAARRSFQSTSMYKWLLQRLQKASGEMYFGALSEALQGSLLDNADVRRRDAKIMLQNLLTWCEVMPNTRVVVDRPRHSQRVRIV